MQRLSRYLLQISAEAKYAICARNNPGRFPDNRLFAQCLEVVSRNRQTIAALDSIGDFISFHVSWRLGVLSLLKKFIVNTAILTPKMDPESCAVGAPDMLVKAGIKDTKIISCYCCMTEGRVVFIVESENKDKALEALNRINVPVASIMEAEEVKPKK